MTIPAITGTIPATDYTLVGIVHGHAETLDPAPLSQVAAAAITGMRDHAHQLGADLIIDVSTSITTHGLEGCRVLATGTAVQLRDELRQDRYRHLLT